MLTNRLVTGTFWRPTSNGSPMRDFKASVRSIGHLVGVQPRTPGARVFHAFVGALAGVLFTSMIMRLWLGGSTGLPLLMAPIGASAVLLFAVPASPLAQPWAIIGGNTISALCGIACMKLIGDPGYAACLAVAVAIAAMTLARCLHPPGGAVALSATIGGPVIVSAGWTFALVPVALNCLLLVAIGWLFNAATRGNYPHRASRYTAATVPKVGYTIADVESVLAQYDELLDVSSEDLDTLFRQVEARAYRRLHGIIRCDQIMQTAVRTLSPDDRIEQAEGVFKSEHAGAVPVLDGDGHLEGLLGADQLAAMGGQTVGQVMNVSPCVASPDAPIDELLPILSGGLYREALVTDPQGRLLGMITQTDLLAAIWRGHIAEQIALNSG
jgi:CBS domain-containing membrane protein